MLKMVLVGTAAALIVAMSLTAICVLLEIVLPEKRQVSASTRLKGLTLGVFAVGSSGAIAVLSSHLFERMGVRPLLAVPPFAAAPIIQVLWGIVGTVFGALAFEFFYYWLHRAQHAFPVLWRFHSVHHSINDISAGNAYAHWTEEFWRALFISLPAGLLVPAGIPTAPWIQTVMMVQAAYVHSQIRLRLGPLNWIICESRYHRIHHSIETRHFDVNFGVFTPIWDWIFGTQYMPAKDEWPNTGLSDQPEIEGVSDYIFRPFLPARASTSPVSIT